MIIILNEKIRKKIKTMNEFYRIIYEETLEYDRILYNYIVINHLEFNLYHELLELLESDLYVEFMELNEIIDNF